jgi:uncharacterized protein (TIGR03067 family)
MSDLENLQGKWQAVWLEDDGRKIPASKVKKTSVTISGDSYTLHQGDQDFSGVITKIDPSENPPTIDFLGARELDGPGKSYRGIYLLEGDEFTVCVAPPGKARPMDFDSRRGSGYWLYLLRRVIPESFADDQDAQGKREASQPVAVSQKESW